jgi:hypothetical protein
MDQAKQIKKIQPELSKSAQDSTDKPTVPVANTPNMLVQNEGALGQKQTMLKSFPKGSTKSSSFMVIAAIIVVLIGVGSGWMMSGVSKGSGGESEKPAGMEDVKVSNGEAGIEDESAFPDSAEGILEEGGIEGEGTHHLVREGGPTKYVYLTSTVIDLESFKGKTVMVWGETISAKHAGWLMDVGKIKVTD